MRARIAAVVLGVNLIGLFGAGLWCRTTSLGTAPVPAADEAFFGVQAENLAHGKSLRGKTGSGKPVDLIYTVVEAPLHRALPPSYEVERLPAVGFGVLAVALTYFLGARILDRTTARIASVLLAVSPIAIIFSRLGWEYCEVPALCVAIVYFASRSRDSRGSRFGLIASYLACIHVSPTVLFLAPLPMAILLAGMVRSETRRSKTSIATMAVFAAVTIVVGLLKKDNPTTRWTYATYHFGPPNWPRFFILAMRHHLGFCQGSPSETGPMLAWGFYGFLGTLFLVGGWRLIANRAWDRLAIVLGTMASAAGFHMVVGPDGFQPGMARYGLFLVVPDVIAVACLVRASMPEPNTAWKRAILGLQVAAMLAIGWILVGSYRIHYFGDYEIQGRAEGESFWTLRTESAEPMARLASILVADSGPKSEPTAVVAEDWWSYKPLEFLLARHEAFSVASVERFDAAGKLKIVNDRLLAGGYAVGRQGDTFDTLIRSRFRPEELKSWRVQVGYHPMYVLYRLERPALARGGAGSDRH